MKEYTFRKWKRINHIKTKEKALVVFLKTCEDVCWSTKLEDVLTFAKDYQEINHRTFDESWALDHMEKIDDLYVLWDYSQAFMD